jgi:ComF family protein
MQPSIAEHLVIPYYHHFYAVGEYKGILKPLINKLKFGGSPLAAQVLANFFMAVVYPRISQLDDEPDAIVPVPLSSWRYAGRGYNQARLLAQAIGLLSNLPTHDCLMRARHTVAQSSLDRVQRLDNLNNAFVLSRSIPYQHIAIVDDVVTTGATINSACKTIVETYPDIKISVWSMAVTPVKTNQSHTLQ